MGNTSTTETTAASIAGDVAKVQATDSTKYLTFFIDDKILGVNIHTVKEIIEYNGVTQVPLTSAHIHGVLNLRGNIVPVINLAERVGISAREISTRSCIVIVEVKDHDTKMDIGIVVDSVNEVLDVIVRDIESAPSFGSDVKPDYIEGMSEYGSNFIVLLDITKVLDIGELSNLACVSQ